MRIPRDKEIRALHEKHAPSPAAFELVHTHCEIVCAIAEQFLARSAPGVNADLVRAGSLLHDIGVYRLYDAAGRIDHANYVRHGLLGHELLAAEGLPEALCRFCSRHTGMGISAVDVRKQRLPLPAVDYVAESEEEWLVTYADKFHSKTDPPVFLTPASYAADVRRFGPEKVAIFDSLRNRYGDPDLAPLSREYGYSTV